MLSVYQLSVEAFTATEISFQDLAVDLYMPITKWDD